jgi:hypothetical protein
MIAPWVQAEMKTVHLNDKRLDKRLVKVLSELAAQPTASIPAACGGRAEMVAAYRLFENPKTNFANVLQPHFESTWQRIAVQSVVLLAQDTTEIDVTRPARQVAGVGPLDGNSRRGALLHETHAFTPDGTPLGTVDAQAWSRDEEPVCRALTRAQRAAIPIEEKESYRSRAASGGTRIVSEVASGSRPPGESELRKPRSASATPIARSRSCGARGPRDAAPASASWPQAPGGDGECRAGQRNRSAAG